MAASFASTADCTRLSSVVRRTASDPAGTSFSAPDAAQSANQPEPWRAVVNRIPAPAWAAASALIAPVAAIAASTSRPRAAAAAGSARGLKREGARGKPAMTADCHSER